MSPSLNTYFTRDGTTWEEPAIQNGLQMYNHCATIVDNDGLFVAGGTGTGDFAYLYSKEGRYGIMRHNYVKSNLLNVPFSFWQRLPDIPTRRGKHVCGVIDRGNGREVVVAGGEGPLGETLDSVEILNLDTMEWRTGSTQN